MINAAHQFGSWLIMYKSGYKTSLATWLDSLRPPRKPTFEDRQHEAVTLEEIIYIAKAPVTEIWEYRIRAAAVFMFLSGIRVGAFVTLPLQAVNLTERKIKQWPNPGVKTKNSKRNTTYMLNLPELLTVVQEWDGMVRSVLPSNGYWFAPLSNQTGNIMEGYNEIGKNRDMRVRTDLKRWLTAVGLTYRSPHKFRH